ncbi:hypothetical protein [Streptosporangium sp. NPDC051022]|uniref:hypothetical protein n=1 Tax=Streptosporangium sp. NPDC051022 TaxID=3155752 RepID=UPI00341B87A5
MEPVEAIADAIRDGLRLHLGRNATLQAVEGIPIRLSGGEADEAARLALGALAEHGLVVVNRDDLAHTVEDADAYDKEYRGELGPPSEQDRLDRLRAALVGAAARPSPAPLASVDELRGEDVTEEDAAALRAHRGDPHQCDAQQALRRVVDLARYLGDVLPVTADDVAAAILGIDRREYQPGEPLVLLERVALDFPGETPWPCSTSATVRSRTSLSGTGAESAGTSFRTPSRWRSVSARTVGQPWALRRVLDAYGSLGFALAGTCRGRGTCCWRKKVEKAGYPSVDLESFPSDLLKNSALELRIEVSAGTTKENNMTARDIDTARQTVATVTGLIDHIADMLVTKGARRDRAVKVATDHVLTKMAAERPTAFGAYVRSLAVLDAA